MRCTSLRALFLDGIFLNAALLCKVGRNNLIRTPSRTELCIAPPHTRAHPPRCPHHPHRGPRAPFFGPAG